MCGRVRTLAGQKDRLAGSRGMHDDEDDDDQRVVVSDWLPGSSGRWFYYGADGGGELMPYNFSFKNSCMHPGRHAYNIQLPYIHTSDLPPNEQCNLAPLGMNY